MTISEIVDETNTGTPANCGWCNTILGQVNHHSGSVCKKCYGLLTRAGVNRSEIFAHIEPGSATLAHN